MNNNNNNALDERQKQIHSKSVALALAFAVICLLVATIYRIATTDTIGWEFWVILGVCLIMAVSSRFFGDIEAPKNINGKPLPLGDSGADKKVRITDYAFKSGIFALACAVMDILLIASGKDDVTDMELAEMILPNLGRIETVVVTAVIAFVSMFIISFVFDYLIGERRVKRYNALMAKLDAEENED